jgi:hypothetical protein
MGNLVLCSNDASAVHVWNLRLIRNRRAERGMDWDIGPFPTINNGSSKPARVLRVKIVGSPDRISNRVGR